MSDREPTTAIEYLRVSKDTSGRERSPEEQHSDNAREALRHGWILGPEYRDIGSASDFSDRTRVDFDRLRLDLESGRFGAEILVLWAISRGSRRLREWMDLIELLAHNKVQVYITAHKRLYDPRNRHDKRAVLEEAMRAEDQAHDISEGVLRALRSNAEQGRPHGLVPFGWRRIYDERTRKFLRQEEDPAEAAVVRELFSLIEAGRAFKAIARVFAQKGYTTRSGLPWTAEHLRSLVCKVSYMGMRTHRGQQVPAVWPAIIDRTQFLKVQRIISAPDRLTHRDSRARWWLSNVVKCDLCGSLLTVRDSGGATMQCHGQGGCVRVSRIELEQIALTAIRAYLNSDAALVEMLAEDNEIDADLERVRAELAEQRAEQDALAHLSARLAAQLEPPILRKIDDLERREKQLLTPTDLRGLVTPGGDVDAQLDAAPVDSMRAIARAVLRPQRVGELRVLKGVRGHRIPVADRVVFVDAEGIRSTNAWLREPVESDRRPFLMSGIRAAEASGDPAELNAARAERFATGAALAAPELSGEDRTTVAGLLGG